MRSIAEKGLGYRRYRWYSNCGYKGDVRRLNFAVWGTAAVSIGSDSHGG
jgi:hypothetical protein